MRRNFAWHFGRISATIMKKLWLVSSGIAFVLAMTFILHAQETETATPIQSSTVSLTATDIAQLPTMSDVQMTALLDMLGSTPTVAAADLPMASAGFFSLAHPEWPPLPADTSGSAAWNLSGGAYLLNDLDFNYDAPQKQTLAKGGLMRSMSMEDLGGGGDGSDSFSYVVPTNGLWLKLESVSGGLAHLDLMNATNSVYAVYNTEDLTGGWQVVAEVWPTNAAVMPFTVPTLGQQTLFLRAADWTGITSGGNTVPWWWFWQNFGTTALSDTNLDSLNVRTLLYDYTNQIDPNPISFTIGVANNYVSTSQPTLSANVSAGTPFYYAVVVDSTNLAGATWTAYTSSNLTASLGSLQGWHQVWVGLRGRPATATPTWQWKRLKLDTLPPVLVITSPTNGTVSVPMIQLTGYSPEALSGISYDLTNALGLVTKQQVLVTDQAYSTNTCEFTTNTFQAFDVAITNGLNTFTLHATDLAGNVTTTNVSFTLDYSSKTNPPSVQISWPLNGDNLSGTNFNVSGQLNDPTATVSVQLVDTNNATNIVNGVVGRDGQFWVPNLPLHSGTNNLTVTVQDVVGNTTTTNLTLVQSPVVLTINPVVAGQVTVTGSINTSGYTVWVNHVQATLSGTNWTVQIPPITIGGGSVEAEAVPNGGGQ
jgi:hypothetical protein